MSSSPGKYNIKAVSTMLNIQPETLRAWERRYKVITPIRNENGYRLYTEEHIKTIKWLLSKINEGFTISQAISILDTKDISHDQNSQNHVKKEYINRLINATYHFNEDGLKEIMDQAFGLFSINTVLTEIITPMLDQVIDTQREDGPLSLSHELFILSFFRTRIGSIMQSMPLPTYGPKAIAICTPGEQYELGLIIFSVFIRQKGINCIYIGPSLDSIHIKNVIEQLKPDFLFISCTMDAYYESTIELIDKVSNQFNDLIIGVGGQAFFGSPDLPCYVGESLSEWDVWITSKVEMIKKFNS